MFCSFCTIPAEAASSSNDPSSRSLGRTAWTWLLISIWVVLMTFAGVSQLDPAWLQAWAESGVTAEASAYKQYGDSFLAQGELGKAIAQYQKAYEIDPSRVGVMTNLAVAYMQAGMPRKAAKVLSAAEKAATERKGPIHFNCGELLRQQGKLEEALGYYQRTVGTTVDQSLVQRQLGQLYLDLDRLTEAGQAFEKTLEHQNDVRRSYHEMLRASIERYEQDTVHLPIIDELLTADPTTDELGQFDFVIVRERLKHDPEIAKTHNYLGLINIKTEDYTAAVSHFRQSASIWPNNVDAMRGLSMLANRPVDKLSSGIKIE